MSIEPTPASNALVERVKQILLRPTEAWERIDTEPASIESLYKGYVAILAAIGPVCSLIGGQVFGYGFVFATFRPSLVGAVVDAALNYAVSLALVYVTALIIDALAPRFGAQKDRLKAFKITAYAATPAWLAGVFGLLPSLLAPALLLGGFYSLYLLHKGLPRLMRAPQDRALAYTAVVILMCILAAAVITTLKGVAAGPLVRVV